MRPDKFYIYKELPSKNGDTFFGWDLIDSLEPSDLDDLIVSYPSRSKKTAEADVRWSKSEGTSASTVRDYEKYFSALTGLYPEPFLERWSLDVNSLENSRRDASSSYREGEGELLINLAKVLTGKKEKFSKFGRIYKRVNGKAFFKSDKKNQDKKTEV